MSLLETAYRAAYAAWKGKPSRETRFTMLFALDRWDIERYNLPYENGVTVLVSRIGPDRQTSANTQATSDDTKRQADAYEAAIEDRREAFADRMR